MMVGLRFILHSVPSMTELASKNFHACGPESVGGSVWMSELTSSSSLEALPVAGCERISKAILHELNQDTADLLQLTETLMK